MKQITNNVLFSLNEMLDIIGENDDAIVMMSGVAHFYLNGIVSKQNYAWKTPEVYNVSRTVLDLYVVCSWV